MTDSICQFYLSSGGLLCLFLRNQLILLLLTTLKDRRTCKQRGKTKEERSDLLVCDPCSGCQSVQTRYAESLVIKAEAKGNQTDCKKPAIFLFSAASGSDCGRRGGGKGDGRKRLDASSTSFILQVYRSGRPASAHHPVPPIVLQKRSLHGQREKKKNFGENPLEMIASDATDCISSRRFLLVYKHAFWRVGGVAGGHDDQTVKRRSELGQSIAQKSGSFFFFVA